MTVFYHWTSKSKTVSSKQARLDLIAAAAYRRKNRVTVAPPSAADNAVRILPPSSRPAQKNKGASA